MRARRRLRWNLLVIALLVLLCLASAMQWARSYAARDVARGRWGWSRADGSRFDAENTIVSSEGGMRLELEWIVFDRERFWKSMLGDFPRRELVLGVRPANLDYRWISDDGFVWLGMG